MTGKKRSKRRIVLHEDNVSMRHGANGAFVEPRRLGTCSSGTGAHLTLNSEKRLYK